MWQQLGKSILRFRIPLLIILTGITVFMGYRAMHVQLSYDFSRAIPIDNPKYKAYQDFRKNFGDDGNLFVLGIQTEKFFTASLFNDYANLEKDLKKIKHGGVTGGAQGEHPCIIHILKAKIISPKEGSILPRSGFTLRAEAPVAWLNEHYRCLCYRWRLVPVGEPIDRPSFDSNKMAFAFFEEGQPRTVSYRFDPKLLKDAIGGYQLILIVTADRVSDADEESDTKSHEDRKMVILEMA